MRRHFHRLAHGPLVRPDLGVLLRHALHHLRAALARARELDPLNKVNLSNLIRAQLYTGQHQAALATAKELEALEVTSFDHMQWIAGAYIANDYHKPSDEVKPDWEMAGIVEDTRLLFGVGLEVANGREWPAWNPGSEFRARREQSLREAGR